ncbi:MAG: GNAT family N-acetyltransferase [Alphaproteobacteria bacterium]|nr:GNAT family N-acetyltransferase [Alphaproteobacteria bacterium]
MAFKTAPSTAASVARYNGDTVAANMALLPQDGLLTLITSVSHLDALAKQWQNLEHDNAITPTVFQSFAWTKSWAENYGNVSVCSEIHVFAGFVANRLVFVWPLMKTHHLGVSTLTWLTDPIGQYGDILCAKDQNAVRWMSNTLQLIKRLKGIDIIRLRHVRENCLVSAFANAHFKDANLHEQAPFLDLNTFSSEADYDARYNTQQRKRRKKIRSKLEEMGPVEFKSLVPGSVNDQAMNEAIAEKNLWLTERGRFNRVLGCPRHVSFLKSLSRHRAEDFEFITTELRAGDKPVSWEIGFNYKGTHFAYITSHVNALTDLSPGRLHMDLSQRLALAMKQQRFDLMVPNDTHKESWCSAKVDTKDYYLPVSVIGKFYGPLYLSMIRPAMRKAYYKLPQNILRFLQQLTRH